jgi:hypothetical protein
VRVNRWISDSVFRRFTLGLMFILGCRLLFEGLK